MHDDARARRRAQQRRQQIRRRRGIALIVIAILVGAGVFVAASALGGGGKKSTAPPTQPTASTDLPAAPAPVAVTTGPRPEPVPGKAELVFNGPTDGKRVALTFDDGFCEACIASIVKTLADTKTKATLFPNGIYARFWEPALDAIRPLVASGQFDLGNHTWNHDDITKMSAARLRKELADNEAWVYEKFGASTLPIMRPPFGTYDTTSVKRMGKLGYTKIVTWSGGSKDWEGDSAAQIIQTVHDEAGPGVIYLFHPNYKTTADALPRIIEDLTARGFEIVTLRELLGMS